MKIAFNFEGFYFTWHGGLNYYRNLFKAIRATGQCEIVLFGGLKQSEDIRKNFPDQPLIALSMLDRRSLAWTRRAIVRKLSQCDLLLESALIANSVDVLSHSNPLGRRSRIPCAAWIADFQHVFLPHLFSKNELAVRDSGMRFACANADLVFVSSQASARDLLTFWAKDGLNISVLPFALPQLELDGLPTKDELLAKYKLEENFLYAPNQFWAHKNHVAIVEAAKILKSRGAALPMFVFSGAMEDYRDNGYSNRVVDLVCEAGLEERFKFLKVIPYKDVLGLMLHTRALVNPSLFEGWSTTVEEAKMMGQAMFLSNLPVHIEQTQTQEQTWLFDPGKPAELADLIQEELEFCRRQPPPPQLIEREFKHFGNAYLNAIGKLTAR